MLIDGLNSQSMTGASGGISAEGVGSRGVLSASAHERLLHDGRDLDDDGRQELLNRAVRRRFTINGAEIGLIDVRASDITAVREATDEGHAPWQTADGKPHAS